ncbi:MAG TPA: MFS transporter [Candidatus Saccharimonadales bacterium]|nr:MFS transporter [Candidatus Saccharimonadales bacterium]
MNAHIFRVFSERSFLLLWIGEIFTQIATNLFNFFLIFTVYTLSHSNTAVSGIVLTFTIPAILFGSIAGAYVDRWDKKKVLIITTSIRALLLIILAFNLNNLFIIYVISLLISILFQFFIPAESPMVPLVVRKDLLLHANGLFSLAIFGSVLVAYVLSGPLLILLKPVENVLLFAGMLIFGVIFTFFIKPYSSKSSQLKKEKLRQINVFKSLKQTFNLIRHTKTITHSLFLLSLSQILILILATIAPGYASQILGIPVEQFPLIFVTPAALGMVIGSIVLINVFHSHPKEKMITVGILLSGIAMLLLPFGSKVTQREIVKDMNTFLPHVFTISIIHFMVVLAFILGLANALVFVPANTRLQEHTTEEIRGKIYGFLNSFIGLMSLIPIIIVGGLADLFGVSAVIVGIGVSLLILGIINICIK